MLTCSPALLGFDCIDRFPLLSALAGIMLALLKRSKSDRY